MSASSPPLNPGDPGGPGGGYTRNRQNGEYTDRLLPTFMDPQGTAGELQYLRMRAVNGSIPNDPFLLRLSVEKYIGGQIHGAFKENKGISYVLKVRSQAQFSRLLRMTKLADGTDITIEEHTTLNQVKCVVSNADTIGLEEDYLAEQLSGQKVKEVRRIKRRNTTTGILDNTPTRILTISGTVIPEHVDFGWSRCRTRHYYPSPMQCFRCWSFGHTGKRCTAPARICGKCSKIHEEDQTPSPATEGATAQSQRRACGEPACCRTCNNSPQHALSSRECPAYKRENAIQIIRVDEGISYPQARREYEAREAAKAPNQARSSYAGVTSSSKDVQIANLEDMVRKLEDDSRKKDKRMADLEAALQSRPVGTRLEAAKEHGPIEELTRQVAELTATVRQLQADLRAKDEMIAELQDRQLTPKNSIITIDGTPNRPPHPLNSTESSPETFRYNIREPKVAAQVTEWIRPNSKTTGEEEEEDKSKGAIPKKAKKPKGKKKHSQENSAEDPNPTKAHPSLSRQGERGEYIDLEALQDSDHSMHSTAASSVAGGKRSHLPTSSNESNPNSGDEARITRSRAKLPRDTVADPPNV